MIGDVKKAEKQLNELLTKPGVSRLLNVFKNTTGNSLTADNYIEQVKHNTPERSEKTLGKLCVNADKLVEIVRLLSTRPHTNSNSNFVKLIRNKVVGNDKLITYLQGDDLGYKPKPVRDALMRYLKLTDKQAEDKIPESEAKKDLQVQLKRKKNKNLLGKIKSGRLVDRLKALVVALLILTIDYAPQRVLSMMNQQLEEVDRKRRKKHEPENTGNQDADRQRQDAGQPTAARPETPGEKAQRWQDGRLTVDEFNNLKVIDAKELTVVHIPEGVTEIKNNTFVSMFNSFLVFDTNETLQKVFIPKSVKTIQHNAFDNCLKLESVNIADGASLDIEDEAFRRCYVLERINIPSGTKSIGESAFGRCDKALKSVTIPGSVHVVGKGAFLSCDSLETVTLEDGVLKISESGFNGCKKLNTIIVPKSLQAIGEDAFKDCPKDMDILGDAKESVKNQIRRQIGQPEVAVGADE
ncbi:MAG: leucine-rich repeat domain-containing protein [Clostridia bacterium]|nr:leucine-rich repeat domain-containing protein [Clostridia bacterium]